MKAKARNLCVEKAIEIKNQTVNELVDREITKSEQNPEYESFYTLKDLNRVKDCLEQIEHHTWIRNTILIDNRRNFFNKPKKPTLTWKVPN